MSQIKAFKVFVIGAGPAGLMAAERLAAHGIEVHVFDAKASAGRKFLLAGKSGLNISHAEELEGFLSRYQPLALSLETAIRQFDASAIRAWCLDLGIPSFVGTSGRIFPEGMKAAPLLRSFMSRLRKLGVHFHMRHRWIAWQENAAVFATEDGEKSLQSDACIFALGGGSWPHLGSDGAWFGEFERNSIILEPLLSSNCGFEREWSTYFREKFAGVPLPSVRLTLTDVNGQVSSKVGQFVVSEYGVEGSLIYAFSGKISTLIQREGHADIYLDLLPGKSFERVLQEISHPRGARSLSAHLKSRVGLHPIHTALLHECLDKVSMQDSLSLAKYLKHLPLKLLRARPIAEAISSAGGIAWEALDTHWMLREKPGVFCAGEMIAWDAPTGGYLLTACFATGRAAADGVLSYLAENSLKLEQKTND